MVLAEASPQLPPAILRLSPELLAIIFQYVYVTPVVHRAVTAGSADSAVPGCISGAAHSSTSTSTFTSTPSNPSAPSSFTSSSSVSFAAASSSSSSSSSSAPNLAINTPTTSCSTALSAAGRRRRDRRKAAAAVYIQNDVASMLSICLTCRAFYPQAVRMLWRQRTLAGYDDLSEFYRAIEFSASQKKRYQKQRQQEQELLGRHHLKQQEQHVQRQDLGYAIEEELFNNEAALRIKSLTLLEQDRTLGSAAGAGAGDATALPTAVDATSSLGSDSIAGLSSQFFGSSSVSHHDGHYSPGGSGAGLDLCQGIDSLQKTSSYAMDDSFLWAAFDKDETTASSSSASSSSASPSRSRSMSQSKRRSRQKTASVYSQMLSPRLLNTIANHCYALVDLTVCIDKRTVPASLNRPSALSPPQQPTIPLSILAGSVLSLKRLTLIGLVCDPQFNKTGSELLMFAKNVQPLERISIRSCQGISVETFVEFAARSHRRLKSIDFQSLDFATTKELTEAIAAYAYHCRSMTSITLSCVNALALDGVMEALAFHQAFELQELHVLGHDIVLTAPQQQQQQPQAQAPVVAAQQQQQPGDPNDNAHNGAQTHVTQMCHLTDATAALSSLSQIRLRRLTLYCPGITDYALFLYICRSSQLVDLVLNEPTTMLHHEQFQGFVQLHLPDGDQHIGTGVQSIQEIDAPVIPPLAEPAPFTSAVFLDLIFHKCHWLKYLFMKLTLETAQEWIAQPCFREAGLDKCLYQYRTATGAPAVVLMWDARKKVATPMIA
ncbi:hypothetical protein BGZ72_009984 [Mortierella alpina]|nr:hypothetical protein BGZ72_009984 [Mortierella alpina]